MRHKTKVEAKKVILPHYMRSKEKMEEKNRAKEILRKEKQFNFFKKLIKTKRNMGTVEFL